MAAILTEIVSILTGALTSFGTAIGSALSALIGSVMIENGSLSTFGGIMFIFFGLSLAVGLSKLIWSFVTSLGKRN